MKIFLNAEIDNKAVSNHLHLLINQIYKLLPNREENLEWRKPLDTIIEELAGMDMVLLGKHDILFPLLCKLSGLKTLTEEEDFYLYRRTIFECLSLCSQLKEQCQDLKI